MEQAMQEALIRLVTPIADDEWIVGHRGSEWLGLAPELEEDLAFSSIHQDEMGHALFFYELLHALGAPDPDRQVYARPAEAWRNACFVEMPNGDWAATVVRRYCYEVFDRLRLDALTAVGFPPLRDGLKKIQREEAYHLKHFQLWMELLANGGEEARHRLDAALAAVWPTLPDLFGWGLGEAETTALGLPSARALKDAWVREVRPRFESWHLSWPNDPPSASWNGREGAHTPHLSELLNTMRAVRELAPDAPW
ncbi:MAG: phenylacetate-CoA oxygenase subunit PaaC [Firmicutes bacterium]|nr:phenylacetate-CoA oxygenase subunit PaaC [Bacillota bacterium]